jgi:hypothetical protein
MSMWDKTCTLVQQRSHCLIQPDSSLFMTHNGDSGMSDAQNWERRYNQVSTSFEHLALSRSCIAFLVPLPTISSSPQCMPPSGEDVSRGLDKGHTTTARSIAAPEEAYTNSCGSKRQSGWRIAALCICSGKAVAVAAVAVAKLSGHRPIQAALSPLEVIIGRGHVFDTASCSPRCDVWTPFWSGCCTWLQTIP